MGIPGCRKIVHHCVKVNYLISIFRLADWLGALLAQLELCNKDQQMFSSYFKYQGTNIRK